MHDQDTLQILTVAVILSIAGLGILAAAFRSDDEDDLNDE